jgi:Outer membrane lipoprotein carrier protein LolA-like
VKGLSAAVMVITMLPLASSAQAPRDEVRPAEILQRVAVAVIPEVGFHEVRTARLLKTPLVSRGRLRYRSGGRLERETLHPVAELVVIDGMQVTIERAGTTTELTLIAGTPQFALVQALRAVLGGQVKELETVYRATAEGSLDRWTLQLDPREAGGVVRAIRLTGSDGLVGEIEVLERNGDKTVTTLTR